MGRHLDDRRSLDEAKFHLLLRSPSAGSTSSDSDLSLSPLPRSPIALPDDGQELILPESYDEPPRRRRVWAARRDPLLLSALFIALATGIALFIAFPFPTTVHVFLGAALALTIWTLASWVRIVYTLALAQLRGSPKANALRRWSTVYFITLIISSGLVFFWLSLGLVPLPEAVPALGHADGSQPRYFIAANLYNSERILPRWTSELVKLLEHLGPSNTFVSIYESNSEDKTPLRLTEFSELLDAIGVQNRIVSDRTTRDWPYNTSPQRIKFLADARNRALAPLQSPDPAVRLPHHDSFTKVLFLNDVYYSWQSAVRLLATSGDDTPGEEGYDLACGMDYFQSGLYDTWVARDVCGTPMRLVWPYVKDPVSIELLRQNKPFPVASCWNGMTAFPAGPYLYRPAEGAEAAPASRMHAKRGWKMVDNATYPGSHMSPALTTPISFRASNISACDHSECFLFSYDLHRLHASRAPRIYMNPTVTTAYAPRWYAWRTGVLRIPAVQWWQRHWSHGLPFRVVDWIWEGFTRKRDYCTWAALVTHAPARCPPLPQAENRGWNE